MGKEEIARNEQFLLFPQCFLLKQITVSSFIYISAIIFLFAAELEKPKIGLSGKRLNKLEENIKSMIKFQNLQFHHSFALKKSLYGQSRSKMRLCAMYVLILIYNTSLNFYVVTDIYRPTLVC